MNDSQILFITLRSLNKCCICESYMWLLALEGLLRYTVWVVLILRRNGAPFCTFDC